MQGGGSGEFSATVYNLIGAWVTRKQQEAVKQAGDDEAKVTEILQKQVASELKLDYIVTGGWSLKAYQEACRLVGEEHVNLVTDARTINDGKVRNRNTFQFCFIRSHVTCLDGLVFLDLFPI